METNFTDMPVWPGSGSYIIAGTGQTPFGYYEDDPDFQDEAPKVADYCAKRLGYPNQDIELLDVNFYTCFEESITEYVNQVNQYRIRENMLNLSGTPLVSGSNLSQKDIGNTLGKVIQLSKHYGTEVGSGGTIDWKRGHIVTISGQQQYDLNVLWANVSESGNEIEIKRIFHTNPPYYTGVSPDNSNTFSYDTRLLLDAFGWGGYAVAGVNYLLTPINYDLMRLQAIEFNHQIRRSTYTFELVNNKLRIFPIPGSSYHIYFDYIVVKDRSNPFSYYGTGSLASSDGSGVIADYSNIPFNRMAYNTINHVGKQWIIKYTLASSKETLGIVRSKYERYNLPIGDVALDGTTLREEGKAEKDYLITQLRENLDEVSRRKQLEKEKDESDYLQQTLQKIPLKIYIG
jgi:hypothetical protein